MFGGPVRVVYDVSKGLVERGHEVVVFTSDAKDMDTRIKYSTTEIDGAQVQYLRNINMITVKKSKFFITPSLCSRVKTEIRSFDVIHLHEYRTFQNMVVAYYAKKYGIPYVLQAHGSLPRIGKIRFKWFFDKVFGYKILKGASKVIALSSFEAEQFLCMGVPEEKIIIMPNGIDLSEYSDLPPKRSFKSKFGLVDKEKIVLYLGRIHRIKGIDFLVRAFANIVEKLDDVKLVIAGPDDGYLDEIENLIKALKIEEKVLITGPLYGKDKLAAYVDAEVYVLPSRYETFPMTVLEASACGTPIILTENCGIVEYFKAKVGLIGKPDSNQLIEALLEILLHPNNQSLRNNSRNLIKRFDISIVIRQLESVYEKALS